MLIISLHSGGRKGSRMDHEDVPRRTIKKKDKQASLMHALLGYSVHSGTATMASSLIVLEEFVQLFDPTNWVSVGLRNIKKTAYSECDTDALQRVPNGERHEA